MASVNFDRHFTLSAPMSGIVQIEAELARRQVAYQRLAVRAAFHSRWIDGAERTFGNFERTLSSRPGGIPLVCCSQPSAVEALPEDFLWRAVRHKINFRSTLAILPGGCRFIDVGPTGTLAAFTKQLLPDASASMIHPVLTLFGRDVRNFSAAVAACAT